MNQWQRLVVTHGLLWNVVLAGVAVTFDIGYSVHILSIFLSPSLTARTNSTDRDTKKKRLRRLRRVFLGVGKRLLKMRITLGFYLQNLGRLRFAKKVKTILP
jgi:hypothetical protein